MNNKNKFIVIFILLTLFYFCGPSYVNTIKSQQQYKKKMNKILAKNPEGIVVTKKNNKIKRRMDDEYEEPTSLVYNRCDHGHTPDDIRDCTKYDTSESSCCIFTYGQDTGCVLIGFKYLGSKSIGDMTVNCYNKYLETFSFISIITMIFIL